MAENGGRDSKTTDYPMKLWHLCALMQSAYNQLGALIGCAKSMLKRVMCWRDLCFLFVEECEFACHDHLILTDLTRYSEVVDVLSRNFINVTDLETLNYLSAQLAAGSPSLVNNVPPVLRNGITRLSITLRLPFAFFETTNAPEKALQVATPAWFWQQIGHMLSRLDSLTKLRLWLDHSNTSSWSLVNERNFLSPLLAHLSTRSLDVAMILPKLHPLHESADLHFMNQDEVKPIRLHRTLRQGWHTLPGTIEVVKQYDFPITADLLDLLDGSCVIPGQDAEDLPLSMVEEIADLEEWERDLYTEGHDAEFVGGIVRDILKHSRELSGKSGKLAAYTESRIR
jgi:hypothetical protein